MYNNFRIGNQASMLKIIDQSVNLLRPIDFVIQLLATEKEQNENTKQTS